MSARSTPLLRLDSTPATHLDRGKFESHTLTRGKPVASVATLRPVPPRQASRSANLFTIPNEPEDARLTGGTRSLERRLLALNLYPISAFPEELEPRIA
jgi:hypothetical protein